MQIVALVVGAIMIPVSLLVRRPPALANAQAEGVALNQLINVAVAEKLSALRTESYFAERARRASVPKALKILKRAGAGRPPMKGR